MSEERPSGSDILSPGGATRRSVEQRDVDGPRAHALHTVRARNRAEA
ncbi:hypothetical protein D187_005482 [Cystobacter fuscus DSM 2262]|uniref:Uncharacterized protein n=1 Tax=Cystobacter fuscus (strain ATCC 25194 / DSM 2262 / NBRC 100088 / M29) TaxID=1242864 RepID=S9R5U1_CYSF2|nr:hypothetical protein D187_005482 [Cystobacter fuscus DSM 2262]